MVKYLKIINVIKPLKNLLSKRLETPVEPQGENSPLDENKGLTEITRGGIYVGTWVNSKLAIHHLFLNL